MTEHHTDRGTDLGTDPFEQDLAVRLQEAADRVAVPLAPPGDDVARGRRRLHRQRVVTGLAALATLAVVGTGAGLALAGRDDQAAPAAAASSSADDTDPPTTAPTSPAPSSEADTRNARQLLHDYATVLREHLDPDGVHLSVRPTNLQGSGEGLGTKLDWKVPGESGLGMVEVFVGPAARSGFTVFCDRYTPCQKRVVDGVAARVQQSDGTTGVLVTRDDGSMVELYVDPLFGNNSLTPVSGMDISVADLVRAGADPRLTPPTADQVRHAEESFGFAAPPGR